jgi:hypothetical protein
LAEKPSVAVLPFENISGDPEQQYFADGIVEENGIFWRPASESLEASKPRLPCGVRGGPARNALTTSGYSVSGICAAYCYCTNNITMALGHIYR